MSHSFSLAAVSPYVENHKQRMGAAPRNTAQGDVRPALNELLWVEGGKTSQWYIVRAPNMLNGISKRLRKVISVRQWLWQDPESVQKLTKERIDFSLAVRAGIYITCIKYHEYVMTRPIPVTLAKIRVVAKRLVSSRAAKLAERVTTAGLTSIKVVDVACDLLCWRGRDGKREGEGDSGDKEALHCYVFVT
ncbi:hypothetical protein NA57DRAFT_61571 [Rhizodiscina lignyota]|uniref:Uncharacterized protein n=1 Tax=Rhizodiscina lignyota TaxID=1504668 RepID=A0A9P4I1U8_9PEZI|nr:hypothetical protein NA57DRAFT_61571 [Rhizodiscina lignyota]